MKLMIEEENQKLEAYNFSMELLTRELYYLRENQPELKRDSNNN